MKPEAEQRLDRWIGRHVSWFAYATGLLLVVVGAYWGLLAAGCAALAALFAVIYGLWDK